MALTITIPGAIEATTGATAPAVLTIGVGIPGPGVPTGGTAGQVLKKLSSTNYDTAWQTDLNSGVWGSITGTLSSQTDLQTALNLKANLASPALTGVPTAPTAATLTSTTQLATTAFVQQELAAGTAVARNLEVEVRNQSGASISAGSIVYISGATGNKPLITLSQANNDANSAQTMGFVKSTIANNGTGYVIVRGVLENIDTSALSEGAQLYLSPSTAGTWTTTKPYAPSHLVYVGVVIRSHPNQGTILVAVQNGYELDELHNVAAQTPSDLDLLSYESSTSLWKNKSFSTLGLLTSANAATTYYPLSGNPSGFLTSASLSGYAQLSGATFTGEVATPASTTTTAGFSIAPGTAPTSPTNGEIWNTGSDLQVRIAGVTETLAEQSWVTTQLGSYLTTASAASTYAALAGATFTGLVSTPASTTTTAGLRIAHGAAPTSPVNGDVWTTTGGFFWRQNGTTYQAVNLSGTQTVSGSITFSNASLTLGNSTAAATYNLGTGATLTATTKAINIGTNGVAGSTTNIAIGSTTGTSTTTLQGTTNGVTAAADTNTTALATTAYVVGQAGSTSPVMDGTATVGTSLKYARADHVHPTDTSRAALASPTFTGIPAAPTAAVDTNTTQLATTAYVVGQGYAKLASPALSGTPTAPTATAGTNTTQVATTAFVQAALPVAATETQAINGTSSTTTISPLTLRHALANAGFTAHTSLVGNYSSYVSGSASVSTLWSNFVGLSVTAANGKVAFLPNSQVAYFSFTSRGKAELNLDWTKPAWFSFRFNYSSAAGIGDSNTVNRVTIGKQSSVFGDLASKGFGVTWTAGTTGAFTVCAHNGTTLTTSASAVTVSNTTYFPTTSSAADFLVYFDGAGNVTLYCNGTQVATTTGGPSSGTLVGGRFTFEADNTTSTSGNVVCDYTGIRSMYAY